jgi:hypothetical protein
MRIAGPLLLIAVACAACSTQSVTGPTSPIWPADRVDTLPRVGGGDIEIMAPAISRQPTTLTDAELHLTLARRR